MKSHNYHVSKPVYFEHFTSLEAALAREKQLKGWKRSKKDALIELDNPEWRDLTDLIEGRGFLRSAQNDT